MAGFKLRKDKPAFDEKGDTGNKKRTYFYTPDIEAMHRKDNEIHFLRVVSFTAVFTIIIVLAFYRWKVSRLEKVLKIKDEHYIGALTGGVVLTGEDSSVNSISSQSHLHAFPATRVVLDQAEHAGLQSRRSSELPENSTGVYHFVLSMSERFLNEELSTVK
ncbi:uncharacterized protein EAE98_009973 [Botrytis deweyae]|uniref:Uncharacterized protein n=1 Tax=Botrytis deweyae TaxID=2478750 RepID=A0ABQ7IA03_9HELO|nr:uncharacterized protein EAE98_009973 [Botrytis deweyae]KAF7917945.1 hypothetical protein EAE98_009973 [Botrytis deweyae]